MSTDELIAGLPGELLVRQGLKDLRAERHTPSALLAAIARPRLTQAGLMDATKGTPQEPELELFRLLRNEGGDAYSRYNSLLRELVSFEQALDRRLSRQHKR